VQYDSESEFVSMQSEIVHRIVLELYLSSSLICALKSIRVALWIYIYNFRIESTRSVCFSFVVYYYLIEHVFVSTDRLL